MRGKVTVVVLVLVICVCVGRVWFNVCRVRQSVAEYIPPTASAQEVDAPRVASQEIAATQVPTQVWPSPTVTLTPFVVIPEPQPEDVFAAATQVFVKKTQVAQFGTATPTPENMVTATFTPQPLVVWNTPTPGNEATATVEALLAEARAVTTGTPTPLPANAVTVTPWPTLTPMPPPTATPLPTATPVFVLLTDKETLSRYVWPTATPAPDVPVVIPEVLVGKIAFASDRFGRSYVFVVDSEGGDIALLTNRESYNEAMARDGVCPSGRFLLYQGQGQHGLDLFIHDYRYDSTWQLTYVGRGAAYDAVWSPDSWRIAFVSNQDGNDEIFVITPDQKTQQLTHSDNGEWHKHPSWSPDGTQIVYWSNERTGRMQIWVMNADGTNQRPLFVSEANDWDPVWIKP